MYMHVSIEDLKGHFHPFMPPASHQHYRTWHMELWGIIYESTGVCVDCSYLQRNLQMNRCVHVVYVYVCMCVQCVCMCVHVLCMLLYVCMCACLSHIHMHYYDCVHVCACVYACMCVCVFMWVCVSMCTCIHCVSACEEILKITSSIIKSCRHTGNRAYFRTFIITDSSLADGPLQAKSCASKQQVLMQNLAGNGLIKNRNYVGTSENMHVDGMMISAF